MRLSKSLLTIVFTAGTALCLAPANGLAQSTDDTQPKSSRMMMSPQDRQLTAKIRKAIMADDSLSMAAKNVKIFAKDGVVILKGEVNSGDEQKAVLAKAVDAAGGADKVNDQTTVKP